MENKPVSLSELLKNIDEKVFKERVEGLINELSYDELKRLKSLVENKIFELEDKFINLYVFDVGISDLKNLKRNAISVPRGYIAEIDENLKVVKYFKEYSRERVKEALPSSNFSVATFDIVRYQIPSNLSNFLKVQTYKLKGVRGFSNKKGIYEIETLYVKPSGKQLFVAKQDKRTRKLMKTDNEIEYFIPILEEEIK